MVALRRSRHPPRSTLASLGTPPTRPSPRHEHLVERSRRPSHANPHERRRTLRRRSRNTKKPLQDGGTIALQAASKGDVFEFHRFRHRTNTRKKLRVYLEVIVELEIKWCYPLGRKSEYGFRRFTTETSTEMGRPRFESWPALRCSSIG